jgi:NmrA-like family
VLSRESSEATFDPDVTVRKTDFSEGDLELALRGQDVVVSAVGATGFQDQKKIIDAAVRAGVKRFMPSEFSANTLSDATIQLLPLFAQKQAILDYLKSKESDRFSWTGVATALLFDWVRTLFVKYI